MIDWYFTVALPQFYFIGIFMKLSEDDRRQLSKMVTTLFDHWNLSVKEQLSLLGVSMENRALLARYRKGAPIANDRDKLERVSILLDIHKALRLLFPNNRELAYTWMTTPNRAFAGATPTQVVEQQGMLGLYSVRNYLDHQSYPISPVYRFSASQNC